MLKRLSILATGRVQGVGFRPSVYRYAQELELCGVVKNTDAGVAIDVEGEQAQIDEFVKRLRTNPPLQARIDSLETQQRTPQGYVVFEIADSRRSGDLLAGMPPDLATCEECLRELFDESNRRFGYPFLNCVNCGPRFSIIRSLPYDRDKTSMHAFTQCAECAAEYTNPANRRFDAQPNACAVCGPQVQLLDAAKRIVEGEPIRHAAMLLREGAILAVKGLGGYHLCCDATNEDTVALLRERKSRPHKAFAVMFDSVEHARQMCEIDEREERELHSCASPIVICRRKPNASLPQNISPDTNDIGVFLPYAPLHHLLCSHIQPLIMTSGNFADEPIAKDEHQLDSLLGPVADFALAHNREILRRCDDSVVRFAMGKRLFIRRSRGFVPDPINVPIEGDSVLAVGAELKNTFCITRQNKAFISQHIGDLDDYRAYKFFCDSVDDLQKLLEVSPVIIAHDMHPDYPNTRYALQRDNVKCCAVQHHHAHIASCMAEHELQEPVIGVALDGTGYGPDGTVWGGEFLVADLKEYRRVAHFNHYRLPGGDEAIKYPARMALSCLASEFSTGKDSPCYSLIKDMPDNEKQAILRMIEKAIRSPLTSSCGRLFDAVSAMLGLCNEATYEGQAAIRLQTAAMQSQEQSSYQFEIENTNDISVLSFSPMIQAIAKDIADKRDVGKIARMFHNTVAAGVCGMCEKIRNMEHEDNIVLSGGVFQNDFLLELIYKRLSENGFTVYYHERVPPNDAGISLGQAAVALERIKDRKILDTGSSILDTVKFTEIQHPGSRI